MANKKSIRSGVYKIDHLATGKMYIGGCTDLKRRWREHRSMLSRGVHPNPSLQADWNQYGQGEFEFSVIEICEKAQLIERERYWISELRFNQQLDLYNKVDYVEVVWPALGFKHTEEAKARISAASKLRKPNLGKRYSAEHRANISAGLKGKQKTAEHTKNAVQARLAKQYKHSPESRLKMSLNGGKLKGEINPKSKVTEKQVIEIRERVRLGEKQNALAKEYKLSKSSLNSIVLRKTWKHV